MGCLENFMTFTIFFVKFYYAIVLRGFQSLFCVNFLVQRFPSLNNIVHTCMPVVNKKTDTVAPADSSDSLADRLREKEVVSNKEHLHLN